LAFPTTGGRSYTATMAWWMRPITWRARSAAGRRETDGGCRRLADPVEHRGQGGARLDLQAIYLAARRGENGYTPVFLPWDVRPDRTPEWYRAIRRDFVARDGTPDGLHGEYPATDIEALAGRQSTGGSRRNG